MPLSFTFNGSDLEVIESFQFKSNKIIEALVERMELQMVKLQQLMRSKTKGRVAESVRNPEAHAEGGKIVGSLKVGGDQTTVSYKGGRAFDVAKIIDQGAKSHVINPLGIKGTRAHEKGATRRFGRDVLHFYSPRLGREIFADYVFHPGVEGSHFVETAIEEMRDDFREALINTLETVVTRKGRV